MSYYFGVEIELIAQPHNVQEPLLRRLYYEELAWSLNRHGLSAISDRLDGSKYRKHPEHYNKWWITKDGSLGDPSYPRIPLEAVSPTLWTLGNWEHEIDTFWYAWDAVFQKPDASSLCGSHIHVSPFPAKAFSLSQLKDIAIGIIFYEPLIQELLPECRQHNKYCRKNTLRSEELQNMGSDDGDELRDVWFYISEGIDDEEELRDFMQESSNPRTDRYVLWNFDNILPGRSGSIEFRGGHGLRGPEATRTWVAFVVAFIHLCLEQDNYSWRRFQNGYSPRQFQRHSMSRFWKDLIKAARFLNIRQHLPSDWSDMLSLFRQDCYEEFDSDVEWLSDDDSSIKSKGDSDFSNSEPSDSDPSDKDTSDEDDYSGGYYHSDDEY
ncbi:putative amidoligase enzyme-domain-containing protein [Nemania sp. NC0429]|nr:putative amidoligase enzyme-domain-containing protein [Nemania sp. NC0429]